MMSRHPEKIQPPSGIHVWLVLWRAFDAVRAYAHQNIASLGLTLSDFAILEVVLHKGPTPVNEIGQLVRLTSGSITTAVDRLESRALVTRKNAESDRRARIVHLTAAGRKLIESAFAAHSEALEQLVTVLSPSERSQLVELLKKLGKHAVIAE